MKTTLIDGKKIKEKILIELAQEVVNLKENGIVPHLVVVQIGDHPASNIYVGHKEKVAKKLGIKFTWEKFDENISFEQLEKEISRLNSLKEVTGIIIQFPLPDSYSKTKTANLVDPKKDADGTTDYNQNIIKQKENKYAPETCTPKGVMRLLSEYNISPKGKNVVVLGRSRIVGNPMKNLLENAGGNVSVINRETASSSIYKLVKDADLIISATGARDVITPDMVKDNVDIIDVGIIRDFNNKLRGDLLYKDFMGIARHITPVPGGVGPMTVIMLMSNVIELAKKWGKNA